MDSESRRKRVAVFILKLALSSAAVWFVLRSVDFESAGRLLHRSSLQPFLGALALLILSQILSAERLALVLKNLQVRVGRVWNIQLYFIGMAYNLFLPGGIGGDAYKLLIYHRSLGSPKRKLFMALLADRLSGLLAILILCALAGGYSGVWHAYRFFIWGGIPLLLWAAHQAGRVFFKEFMSGFWPVTALSMGVQLLQIASIVLLARAFQFDATLVQVALLFLISTLATTIPVFLGGIGAREAVFALLASQLALNVPEAVATALAFSLITVLASVPGLLFDWTLKK